jgi:sucrose phosphorylase
VIDVAGDGHREGLVPDAELARLVERIHANSRGESARATGAAAANLDLYQVNCTFYDALGGDDLAYLLCRAIQLFLPGVPQIYYVGLLAGGNDMQLLARTGVGRDINRHHYTRAEIDAALERPVVARLCELVRLRSSHPAFDGDFKSAEAGDDELDLRWRSGAHFARLHVNVRSRAHRLECSRDGRSERVDLGANGGTRG